MGLRLMVSTMPVFFLNGQSFHHYRVCSIHIDDGVEVAKMGNCFSSIPSADDQAAQQPRVGLNSLLVNIWGTAEQLRSEVVLTFCPELLSNKP